MPVARWGGVQGVITLRHLVTHAPRIVRLFGVRCYARCWWRIATRRRPVTFLECVTAPAVIDSVRPSAAHRL
jgi:hypothetical protein